MKTNHKLLNVSSAQYDKAEAVAFFHAIIAPIFVGIVTHFIDAKYSIISGISYVLMLAAINLYRHETTNDAFLQQKSEMYFECLKYSFGLFFLVMLYVSLMAMIGA
ncbi:MAG: hypothetical protein WC656_01335 [Sulfurimonas sp.]|jgi:hypothetical protein